MPWLDAFFAFLTGAAMALALSSLTNWFAWGPRAQPVDQAATALMIGGALAGSRIGDVSHHNLVGVIGGVLIGGVAASILRTVAAR